jgi:thiol-disulfide isomerase/thioredoxin
MYKSVFRTALSALIICCATASFSLSAEPLQTRLAPVFKLPGQNKTIDLSKYRGKVVYLDFWASWCAPCKRSFPWMNQLQEQYSQDGLEIVAVNVDESRKDADEFLNKVPANFTIAYDHKGKTAKVYKLKAMPSSFLIDKDGRLVHRSLGYRNDEKKVIEAKIRQLTGRQVAKR